MSADVVVVGSGPAGAVSALLLARAGHDVVLIDRAPFPRGKACGDCLSAAATGVLERLGVLGGITRCAHAGLAGWRIFAPDGTAFSARFDDAPALAVERALLDDVLQRAAVAGGVRLVTDHVTDVVVEDGVARGVVSRSRRYHARLVIGADGLRSVVAARLRLRTGRAAPYKVSLTWHIDRRIIDDDYGEMHAGDGFCAGFAPVGAARTNVTFVFDSARFGRAVADDPAAAAAAALASLPAAARRFDPAVLRNAPFLASGPFHTRVPRCVTDGAALVGDAAGYYDPFTGQGVHQALTGAELLARCADTALRRGAYVTARSLEPYEKERQRSLRGARMVQRGIEAVLSRPRLADALIARIRRAPAFARALVAVTGDVQPASSLLSPRTLSSLILPATETGA